MNNKKHISLTDISDFQQDQLSRLDLEIFLEHVGSCDLCSDLLAESMEEELISAPVDMKANIIKKTKSPSKNMQLFSYSLRVVTASAAAIALLLLTFKIPNTYKKIEVPPKVEISDIEQPTLTSSIRNTMDQFSNQILEFSNTIINTEVIKNDQKEE